MEYQYLSTLIAALICGLMLAAGHYLPWRQILGKPLPRIPAYIYGVLAIALPVSGLLIVWGYIHVLVSFWVVLVAAGLTVSACYALDSYLSNRWRAAEAEERERNLEQGLERQLIRQPYNYSLHKE